MNPQQTPEQDPNALNALNAPKAKIPAVAMATALALLAAGAATWPLTSVMNFGEMPYLHSSTLLVRLGLAALLFSAATVAVIVAMTPAQRKSWGTTLSKKGEMGIAAIVWCTSVWIAADLSGNTFGPLVQYLPGSKHTREFVVKDSDLSGNKASARKLVLTSATDGKTYRIAMARSAFGEVPSIKVGQVVIFETKENVFGAVVQDYAIKK